MSSGFNKFIMASVKDAANTFLYESVPQVMDHISATYCTDSCFVAYQALIISVRQFIQNLDFQK